MERYVAVMPRMYYQGMWMFSLLLLMSIPAEGAGIRFPGPSQNPSPAGHYTVIYNARTDTGKAVFLEDLWTGHITKLLTVNRAVDVLWAPDGNIVAITDWMTTNASTIWIVEPGRPDALLDLGAITHQFLKDDPMTIKNDHVFYEALRWRDPKILVFRILGHGDHDPGGFEDLFEYQLGGTVSRVDR